MMRICTFLIGLLCTLELAAQGEVVPGLLQVRLKPAVAQSLQDPLAIRPLGVANARYQAVGMKPVFQVGGPFEARQRRYGLHLWYELQIDTTTDMRAAAASYLAAGAVDVATPVYRISRPEEAVIPYRPVAAPAAATLTPDDPFFPQQWNLNNTGQTASKAVAGVDIRMPAAWTLATVRPEVVVAVIDGGIDYNHPDLRDNMWVNEAEFNGRPGIDDDGNGYVDDIYGYNFTSSTPVAYTPNNHGTHVAGIVAARSNDALGVAGIAGGWGAARGVRMISCAIFSGMYTASATDIARAIQYAADNGAVIAQNSWGYDAAGYYDPVVRTAINYFIDNAGKDNDGLALPGTPMAGGILFFVSGNDNSAREDWYPGAFDEVTSVAAVAPNGLRAYYSNYSKTVDITAPGGDLQLSNPQGAILSTLSLASGGYGWMQGTSMACPHVSGVAALVLSKFGSATYTPAMLRRCLLASVNPLPNEPQYLAGKMGAGLIDASKALADNVIRVQAVTLSPSSLSLLVGDTASLSVTFIPADATNREVEWESAAPSVVAVSPTGDITALQAGNTTVSVTSADGGHRAACAVTVYASPRIPEAFSPNGDGINDYFDIVLDSRETYSLQVFDRSGQPYYLWDDYRGAWDAVANTGRHSGEKMLPGTYFYRLSALRSGRSWSGWVVVRY